MEPQNKPERNKSIRRFSALFIGGILLVAIPLYLTMRLPGRENRLTSEELQNLQAQLDFQRDYFALRMDSVKHLLDSYDTDGIDIDKLNADIGFLLSEMENSIAEDTSWRFNMYENIIDTYLSVKKTHNSLKEVSAELAKCRSGLRSSRARRPSDSLDPE